MDINWPATFALWAKVLLPLLGLLWGIVWFVRRRR